jgi:hypothetical protein
MEGNLSMKIRDGLRSWCARTLLLEQLIVVHSVSADLRFALAALALRSFTAMWAAAQVRLMSPIQDAARGGHKAGFADDTATADTTVAAARG